MNIDTPRTPWVPANTDPNVTVFCHGRGSAAHTARTVEAIGAVLAARRAATAARVRLSTSPCGTQMLVQVNMRVEGSPARIQITGAPNTVVAAAAARLDHRIRQLTAGVPRSGPWMWPRSWPDPQRPALAVPGPGHIVRRKVYPLLSDGPRQAAIVMDAMDFDVYLFTDTTTGQDAVIYRDGPTGLRLARQHGGHPAARPTHLPITVTVAPAPLCCPIEATRRLCDEGVAFLLFADPATGRAGLLYRRHDSNLALITPAPSQHTALGRGR